MNVEKAVNGLIADIDQLNRLFLQLSQVPQEVQDLVSILADIWSRLMISSRLLAKAGVPDGVSPGNDVLTGKAFVRFRSRLIDLQLLIDPEQFLHHSGIGAANRGAVSWDSCDHGDVQDFCVHFREHIFQLDDCCSSLNSVLNARVRLTPETEEKPFHSSASPSLASLRSFALGTAAISRQGSPANPSARGVKSRRGSPRTKTEEEIIFDKFVQQFSKGTPVGKRKRPGQRDETQLVGLEALSKQLPFPFPAGQEGLRQLERQIRGSVGFDNDDVPEWNLDELRSALPNTGNVSPRSMASTLQSSIAWGKQRQGAQSFSTLHLTEYNSSNSSGSFRSMPREGSVFSNTSLDRMYDDGACKLWHHIGASSLRQIEIARTDIRREYTQSNGIHGIAITIASTTPTGKEIQDQLWHPVLGDNSAPFLEHIDVVAAFKRHDPRANYVVRFAPNANKHPQYSFITREDCWDFLQAITDKVLLASIDIDSIKSAATHGNVVESGTETLQIWEDSHTSRRTIRFFRNKNEAARQKVVELDVRCLKQPSKERRTGKLTIEIRDANDEVTRELRYLKIGFANQDAEEGFMHECGFRKESVTSVSTVGTARFKPVWEEQQ